MFQAHTSQQKVPKKPIYAPSKHVFGALVCIFEPLKPLLLRNSNLSYYGCKLQATSHICLHFLTHAMPCTTMRELGFIQSKHFFGALVCIFEPRKPLLLRNSNLSFCGCKLRATSHICLHFLTHSMPCSTMKELGFIQSKHFLFVSLNLLTLSYYAIPTCHFVTANFELRHTFFCTFSHMHYLAQL